MAQLFAPPDAPRFGAAGAPDATATLPPPPVPPVAVYGFGVLLPGNDVHADMPERIVVTDPFGGVLFHVAWPRKCGTFRDSLELCRGGGGGGTTTGSEGAVVWRWSFWKGRLTEAATGREARCEWDTKVATQVDWVSYEQLDGKRLRWQADREMRMHSSARWDLCRYALLDERGQVLAEFGFRPTHMLLVHRPDFDQLQSMAALAALLRRSWHRMASASHSRRKSGTGFVPSGFVRDEERYFFDVDVLRGEAQRRLAPAGGPPPPPPPPPPPLQPQHMAPMLGGGGMAYKY